LLKTHNSSQCPCGWRHAGPPPGDPVQR
jgi:hypothetical protein